MSTLILKLCIPDEPSSFRNGIDSKEWRAMVQQEHQDGQAREVALLGSNLVPAPVSCKVSLRILHLYSAGCARRDVDNTAKPIMDALNKLAYLDDYQVRDLSFVSAPIFSRLADVELARNNGAFAAPLTNLLQRAGDKELTHVTILEVRDITEDLKETDSKFFLHLSKSGAEERLG